MCPGTSSLTQKRMYPCKSFVIMVLCFILWRCLTEHAFPLQPEVSYAYLLYPYLCYLIQLVRTDTHLLLQSKCMLCLLGVGWSFLPRCSLYSYFGFSLKPNGQWTILQLILGYQKLFKIKSKTFRERQEFVKIFATFYPATKFCITEAWTNPIQ